MVHDTGRGRAIVMAHGTMMDWSMFIPQIAALRTEYRVIAYDQRARTHDYDTDYTLADLAHDCRDLLDDLEIESCVLVGMSMGGFMAMEFAGLFPERLDGLILIGSQIGDYAPAQRAHLLAEFRRYDIPGKVPRALAERAALTVFSEASRQNRRPLVAEWLERWCELPARAVYREAISWVNKPDHTAIARAFAKPVLAVHGEDDAALEVGPTIVAMRSAFANFRAVRPGDAGHLVNLERPEPTNAAIRRFLRSL